MSAEQECGLFFADTWVDGTSNENFQHDIAFNP